MLKFLIDFKFRIFILFAIVASGYVITGCRQDPANPPKYYQSELKAMRRQAAREDAQKEEKFLPDKYPWEGSKKDSPSLTTRISTMEKGIDDELDYLHTFVNGKKSCKPRLRD
ncbi:MAG: hypothetical protein ACQETH_10270 [Candidatus Rifleibacteriota bacterium]